MVQATQSSNPSKKPVLRSISTIGENENTYNNINFKRRKIQSESQPIVKKQRVVSDLEEDEDEESTPRFQIPVHEESDEDFSEEERLFNSEDDNEYYSAISDYESDNLLKPVRQQQQQQHHRRFINHSKAFQFRKNQDEESTRLDQDKFLQMGQDSFFESESDSEVGETPINTQFNLMGNSFGELKSLEENLQKIIDENHKSSSSTSSTSPTSASEESSASVMTNNNNTDSTITIDDFVDYTSDVVSSDEDSESTTAFPTRASSKLLHYRHDERHNLAFVDIPTFPVRYDPTSSKSMTMNSKKSIRALKRRAILSGKASEMVGTGMSIGEFNIF